MSCPGCGRTEHAGPCKLPQEREPAPGDLKIGSTLCHGRYLVEKILGTPHGGHYRVYDQLHKGRPTLWELPCGTEGEMVPARFETLATSLMQIDHERIRSVTDFFVEGGRVYLVIGFVEGRTVLELVAETGARGLPEDEVVDMGLQTLEIVNHLHTSTPPRICGSQIPDCLVITPDQKVYLRDFGVSELRQSLGLREVRPEAMACYSPFEVLKGKPELHSDLYSVGAVMHLLLTGRPATGFGFAPVRSVRPDVSVTMEELLDRAVRLIPANRFPSAREMASSLAHLVRPRSKDTPRRSGVASEPRALAAPPSPVAVDAGKAVNGVSRLAQELADAIRLADSGEPASALNTVLLPRAATRRAKPPRPPAVADVQVVPEPAPPPPAPEKNARRGKPAATFSPAESVPPPRSLARLPPGCGVTVHAQDGSELVTIPEGDYTIGSDFCDLEAPEHRVHLRSFRIGRAPVNNEQFEEFVSQTGYQPLGRWRELFVPELRQCPATGVTWEDATAYCRWAELRLPSEAEWEAAARGPEAFPYPWGHTWQDNLCNWRGLSDAALVARRPLIGHDMGLLPAGCFPGGATSLGVLDLLGNVWEWCSTLFKPYPYSLLDGREGGDQGEARVLRGGSCRSGRADLRCSARRYYDPLMQTGTIGFRVASD